MKNIKSTLPERSPNSSGKASTLDWGASASVCIRVSSNSWAERPVVLQSLGPTRGRYFGQRQLFDLTFQFQDPKVEKESWNKGIPTSWSKGSELEESPPDQPQKYEVWELIISIWRGSRTRQLITRPTLRKERPVQRKHFRRNT